MNHQQYEDWLFAYYDPIEETLTPQQVAELRTHLQTCPHCQNLADAWREMDAQLRRSPEVEPQPGFSSRWQSRLEAQSQRLHRRQSLATLGFALGGAALVLGSLVVMAWPWLSKPSLLVWGSLYQLVMLLNYADGIRQPMAAFLRSTGGLVPLVGWVFFVGVITELAVLWVVSLRLLTNPRRITQ